MESSRIWIANVPIDVLDFPGALARLAELAKSGSGGTVFTPNVDHVMRAERDRAFREAYAASALSLVDGKPVVWAASLLGAPLPEKLSGSDLVHPLFAMAEREGLSVYFVGGRMGATEIVVEKLATQYPRLKVIGRSDPTRVLETAIDAKLAEVAAEIAECKPSFVLVALGSPRQELWAHSVAPRLAPSVFLGIGSALDLVAGQITRSPRWMSDAGLEWLYRLGKEPRRLWRRYLLDDMPFLALVLREMRRKAKAK